jgi:hypothetical protein
MSHIKDKLEALLEVFVIELVLRWRVLTCFRLSKVAEV